jgi:integrase
VVKVERNMEQTKARGLRIKSPKTAAGRRTIKLPGSTVEILRAHYRQQIGLRLQLGLGGRPGAEDFVFTLLDGRPYPPSNLSAAWIKLLRARKLPPIRFHAMRHSHASALIAAGLDVVTVSKRLGHSNPTMTLRIYSHLFDHSTDAAAADAIEKALGSGLGPKA